VTLKLGQISKTRPWFKNLWSVASSHCKWQRVSFWKWPDFQLWRACDLDLGLGHTAYLRASLIDLYLYAKFHWNQRNFLWTERRTDRHLRPALLCWLCQRVDLRLPILVTEHWDQSQSPGVQAVTLQVIHSVLVS